jgi:hypothetical protein
MCLLYELRKFQQQLNEDRFSDAFLAALNLRPISMRWHLVKVDGYIRILYFLGALLSSFWPCYKGFIKPLETRHARSYVRWLF